MAMLFRSLVVMCMLVAGGGAAHAAEKSNFTTLYDGLLRDYVSEGSIESMGVMVVDYEAWEADPRHEQALQHLKQEQPDDRREEKLAFWINVYNFLTIDLVIKKDVTRAITDLGNLFTNPWKRFSWKMHGEWLSLYHIEHEIIRPMGEPRALLVLCNSAISAPDIRAEAYRADRLDAQMGEQITRFVGNVLKGVVVYGDTLEASGIFKHYEKDFGGEDGAIALIGAYRDDVKAHMWFSKYMPYVWLVNSKANHIASPRPAYTGDS